MDKWYRQSKWRNLVDMHIPDWNETFLSQFDPVAYAEHLNVSEADCAIFYAGNCLGYCFWPTRAGHMHKGLKGRDIVSGTVEACRAKGMRTIVYFNIWNRVEFDRHPDWRMRYIDGRDTTRNQDKTRNRYGVCCLNNPDFRSFVRCQIEDLADHVPCDGFWIDMIGWNGTICYCPSCRKRYFDETGCEIPEIVNWYDPVWVRFQRSREAWFTDFTQIIDQAIRTRQPDATIAYQCGTSLGGWIGAASQDFLSMSDYLAGDFDSNALSCSTICKILSSATRNKPVEFMTARCTSLADHTTIKSYQQFRQNVAVAVSRNCAFCFIDAIDPVGTMNRRFYEQMGRLHQEMKVFMDAAVPEAKLLRDVTIYHNLESGVDVSMNNKPITTFSNTIWGGSIGTQLPRLRNMSKAFIAHHLAFDIACWNSRQDMLDESQVIVVPNQLMLDDDEINMLKQFAMAGGSVVISGRSGYCDKSGQVRTDSSLEELTGVKLLSETAEDVVYFRPAEEWLELFSPYDAANPLSIQRTAMLIQAAPEVDVLARLTLPCSHSREIHQFGSAISNPPWHNTDYPVVTLHRYGKGKVMYLAAPLEEIEYAAQQSIFCTLVRKMMCHEPLLQTDAPAWLEFLAYYDTKKQNYLLYACKTMESYHALSVWNTSLSLRLPKDIGLIRKIGTNEIVSFVRDSDRIKWTESEMNDFTMYRFEAST